MNIFNKNENKVDCECSSRYFIIKALKGIFGATFLAFGLLGCAVSLLAIIDPVGAKMADDSDPFGMPPSIFSSLVLLVFFIAVSGLGAYLVFRLRRSTTDVQ